MSYLWLSWTEKSDPHVSWLQEQTFNVDRAKDPDQKRLTHFQTTLSVLSGNEMIKHKPESCGNLPCRTTKSLGIGRCRDMISIGKGVLILHAFFYLSSDPSKMISALPIAEPISQCESDMYTNVTYRLHN